jgi:serine/threonine protein kinase
VSLWICGCCAAGADHKKRWSTLRRRVQTDRSSSDQWRRIEEVFQSALDIPEEQRDAWLSNACAGDVELRQEVDGLLARDAGESPLISSIIEGTAASLFDDDAPPDAMTGLELGNYRVIRELGRGGMGAVYLAVRADQTFDKQVAIKLVKRGIDTDAVQQRFWYERRILAALDHPYIARLIDGGTSPDGRPYFVMEYVDGKPLDVYAREQKLSVEQRCELFRKICEAVSYAHRNLIIHRDLKPANVLVTSDGTPKLLDFGIARLLNADPGEHTILGPSSARALTPEYASPEQVRGDAVTTATDVYSLGATLKAILSAAGRLPADLNTIINKATCEEAEQRFSSVADLSEDVRRYLAGMPIMAREQTLIYQAGKFVKRHRVGVTVFALANLLAVAGIGAIVWESRKAEVQRKEAEQRLSQAVDMAERALADVNNSIASLPGATEARRQMVRSTLEYLDRLSRDSGRNPRVLTALATAYVRVGEVLGNSDFPNLGDLPGSLATYQKATGILTGLLGDEPDDLKIRDLASSAHAGTGNVLESMGRYTDAESEIRAAVALAEGTLARNPHRVESQNASLDAHFALDMLLYSAHPDVVEKDARNQLPLATKLAQARPDDLGAQDTLSQYLAIIGMTINRQNRMQEALGFYRKAAEVREAIYRKSPRNTKYQRSLIIGYGHVGDMLGNPFTGCLGDYEGALDYYQKARRIAEDMNRADPSDKRAAFDLAMIFTRMGATRQAAGDLKHADEDLDRAIAQFEPLVKSSPGNSTYEHGVAIAYEYRGRNMFLLGDRTAAMMWYGKSLSLCERLLAERPTDTGARLQRVADKGPISTLLALGGDREGAVKMAQEAVTEAEYNLPRGGTLPSTARAWLSYAETFEALKDCKSASAAYLKSAETWKKTGAALTGPFAQQMREAERNAVRCK